MAPEMAGPDSRDQIVLNYCHQHQSENSSVIIDQNSMLTSKPVSIAGFLVPADFIFEFHN